MLSPTGRRIRALRIRLGLTQEALAQLIGASFSTLNRWENGHNTPKGINARMLAVLELSSEVPDIGDRMPAWSQRGPLFTLYRLLGEVFERSDWLEQLSELQRELELERQLAQTVSPACRGRRGPA